MLKNKNGFTLIELIVVITIIAILTLFSYSPYNLYSNISKVKISKEIIDQAKNEAYLDANSMIDKNTKRNLSIWIRMEQDKNTLDLVWWDYSLSWSVLFSNTWTLLKKIKLEDWVNVNKISFSWGVDSSWALIFFKAPDWNMSIYKNPTETWSEINITIWFKNATSWILSRIINIKN